MSLILLKTFHYLAILFAGGLLVGGGLIQAVYARANQVPDINIAKVLKILGYLGLASLIICTLSVLLLVALISSIKFSILNYITFIYLFLILMLLCVYIYHQTLSIYLDNYNEIYLNLDNIPFYTFYLRYYCLQLLLL